MARVDDLVHLRVFFMALIFSSRSPLSANPWETSRSHGDGPLSEYHLRINGMFTLRETPGVRGVGSLRERVRVHTLLAAARI